MYFFQFSHGGKNRLFDCLRLKYYVELNLLFSSAEYLIRIVPIRPRHFLGPDSSCLKARNFHQPRIGPVEDRKHRPFVGKIARSAVGLVNSS